MRCNEEAASKRAFSTSHPLTLLDVLKEALPAMMGAGLLAGRPN
jgi:hypothetical protein